MFNRFRDDVLSVCPVTVGAPEVSASKTRVHEIRRTVENGNADTRVSERFLPE